jgi:ubiquitin
MMYPSINITNPVTIWEKNIDQNSTLTKKNKQVCENRNIQQFTDKTEKPNSMQTILNVSHHRSVATHSKYKHKETQVHAHVGRTERQTQTSETFLTIKE